MISDRSWHEHEEILAALEKRDAVTTWRLAVEHSRRTQEAFALQFSGLAVTASPAFPVVRISKAPDPHPLCIQFPPAKRSEGAGDEQEA